MSKFGVALSGGGARGVAHLGILQALKEHGIVPEIYTGTSAGSIVAAAKALDYDDVKTAEIMTEIDRKILDINYWGIFKNIPNGMRKLEAIAKGKRLDKILRSHFSVDMTKVKYPLGIVSTDISTATQILFTSQKTEIPENFDNRVIAYHNAPMLMSNMLYASSALPIIFPPLRYGGHQLVDGGITNNLPGNLCKCLGADKVLAIDISSQSEYKEAKNIFDMVSQSFGIITDQNENYSMSLAGDYLCISPDVEEIGLLDFNESARCFDIGYKYGQIILPMVQKFLYRDE